jgi:hypothetical protein
MLLGNFKRGKDKKKRKSRGLAAIGVGGLVGAAAGGGIGYSQNDIKKLAGNKVLEDSPELLKTVSKKGTTKAVKSALVNEAAVSRLASDPDWAKSLGKTRNIKAGTAAVVGLGLGVAGGVAYNKLKEKPAKNREKSATEARKWISTANSTSESVRGWLNTGKRLGLY